MTITKAGSMGVYLLPRGTECKQWSHFEMWQPVPRNEGGEEEATRGGEEPQEGKEKRHEDWAAEGLAQTAASE